MRLEEGLSHKKESSKSFRTALWLSVFLGLWGIDSFYLGDTKTGFLKLFTAGGFLVLWVRDIVRISKGLDTSGEQLRGFSATSRKKSFIAISCVAIVLWVIGVSNPSAFSVNYPTEYKDEVNVDENGYQEFTYSSCMNIKRAITMIRSGVADTSTTVDQMTLLLQSASSTWYTESLKYSGSRSAWLNQLSSLADELIMELNGRSPSFNDVYQALVNNMNLESQWCD